jgi:hypothetical protein
MPILLFIIPIHDSIENSNYGSGDYKSRSLSYVQFIRTMSYNFMPSPMLVFFCQLWTDNPMEVQFDFGLHKWLPHNSNFIMDCKNGVLLNS